MPQSRTSMNCSVVLRLIERAIVVDEMALCERSSEVSVHLPWQLDGNGR